MSELGVWLTFSATVVGPGAILWFMRREFNKQDAAISAIKARMDCFETSQHTCQLENARSFATKEELRDVTDRVEKHSSDIAEIKGRLSK